MSLTKPELSCGSCALSRICLPANLSCEETRILDGAVERGRPLRAGARLFRAGARMDALYAVRSGAAKSCGLTRDGEEYVRAFYLPGEVVGLEGFACGRHPSDVVALEPMRYCRIPSGRVERLMATLPGLRRELLRLLGQSLEEAQRMRVEMSTVDARGRLARFLVDLSSRLEQRNLSPTHFRLSMSRRDIARHLGLTLETVSRTLGSFRRASWLEVRARYIELLQPAALASLLVR
ncbi:MAG TPA: helix-turn-helix domain-containing protein [Steroidobacteraceae bacterium]|nr:helix-turn-helix domain-containing protein [Steroidobacteraceae bacterium]